MSFASLPAGFALALLACVAAAVALLYWLKPSPRRVTVASALIWRRVLRERKRTPDRLRWWLSLLLAMLIALSLALAIAQPEWGALGSRAQRTVLILDNSTTLAARTSDGKTRWEHALERARDLVRSGGSGSRVLVADTQRSIAAPRFEDTATALGTLNRLRVVAGGAPVFPHVMDAGGTGRILLITDGVAGIAPPAGVETVSVFQTADNAGITAFDVRALPGDRRRFQALVEVFNASPAARRVELQLAGAGAQPLVRTLTIPAGGVVGETFDLAGFAEGPLRASLALQDDALSIDDVAFSFLPAHKPLRIGLVTAGNAPLERSLRLLPGTQIRVVTAAGYRPGERVDAWVFDRYAPRQMPEVPALLFRPQRAAWLPAASGDIGSTAVAAWLRAHPITDALSLRDVLVEHALALRPAAGQTVVAADQRGRPLIVSSTAGARWVEVAFALNDSNFPLHPGFPVFLSNVLDWMTAEPVAEQARIGVVRLPLARAKVLDLQGQAVPVREAPGETMIDAAEPGFFTAISPEQRVRVAVNLADPALSAINTSRLSAQETPPVAPATAAAWFGSWWFALLLLAVPLMTLEWWTYSRRLTI